MKILPVALIREADAFTIAHEPIADIDLMERAASVCAGWLKVHVPHERQIKVFCGPGNNGGDGLAIARMLIADGFGVGVFVLSGAGRMSESCFINFRRLKEPGNNDLKEFMEVADQGDLPSLTQSDVVIDAIFGNGLTRPAEGLAAETIRHINEGGATVISIDIPSGLFCDLTTSPVSAGKVVLADHTLTFAPPKLAFFFPENDRFVGDWHLLDIGLSRDFIDSAPVVNFTVGSDEVAPILKKRNKFAHKGLFGHALLVAGSTGKMGAAVLSASACLRSGPGLVTVRVPQSGAAILQAGVPEAMLAIDPAMDLYSEVPDLSFYTAIAAGPGLGTLPQTATALKLLIQQTKTPVIFDADAINIIAENKTWLGFIPAGCIFTPHPKEFERLVGKSSDHFERNRMQREFSIRNRCYMVLKGAHTAITDPEGRCYFNTTGNPGMATGGSGDVLTGILAGLMAQGYTPLESCLLGVFVHGLAGDTAQREQGYEALIAGDIISNLGKSFTSLYGKL